MNIVPERPVDLTEAILVCVIGESFRAQALSDLKKGPMIAIHRRARGRERNSVHETD